MLNIKDLDPNSLKIDQKSYKNIYYYIVIYYYIILYYYYILLYWIYHNEKF